jgi:hypothetical protein
MSEEKKPRLTQIGNLIREMTPEEEAAHEALIANAPVIASAD